MLPKDGLADTRDGLLIGLSGGNVDNVSVFAVLRRGRYDPEFKSRFAKVLEKPIYGRAPDRGSGGK